MRASLTIFLAIAACSCRDHRDPRAPIAQNVPVPPVVAKISATTPIDPTAPLTIQTLGIPLRSARTWTTALSPNPRNGWNLITQTYELNAETPTEFAVIDLETRKATTIEGAPKIYAAQKFQVGSQLRAPNGRIFFPEVGVHMAYYDPAGETVKELGSILVPLGANKMIYQAGFGPDGMLYLGTQSDALPTILQLDPDTLKVRRLGEVGQHRNGYSYAYYMATDPPWVYVAVGESPWELAALNITTGESRVLATVTDKPWMEVETRPEGVVAKLITGLRTPQQHAELVWCVDGKVVPYSQPPPSRNLKRVSNPLVSAPEVDLTAINPDNYGVVHVRWRRPGGDWVEVSHQTKYTAKIDLESLTALPDGSLLGNAVGYHGFFRYQPSASNLTFFGAHGPSRPAIAQLGGNVYIAGYPNGELYEYVPAKPWTAKGMDVARDPAANPRWLGTFAESGAKYGSALVASGDRLYFAGRRERDGVGGAIGYYVPSTATFAGHHRGLNFLDPRGLVAIEPLQRVVLSGVLHPDGEHPDETPAQAELVVFDRELAELERVPIQPGLTSTGELFTTPESTAVIGLVRENRALYRYDLRTKKVDWKPLGSDVIGATTQRAADGSIWAVIDDRLTRIDPATLEVIGIGPADPLLHDAARLTWLGNDLYFIVHAELFRLAHVGTP